MQRDYICWRAPELARSGQFRDWKEIMRQLREEGADEADRLVSIHESQWLSRLCEESTMAPPEKNAAKLVKILFERGMGPQAQMRFAQLQAIAVENGIDGLDQTAALEVAGKKGWIAHADKQEYVVLTLIGWEAGYG